MYEFVTYDFSVYTGITKSCVISFPAFIPKIKWRKIILLFLYV